MFLAKNKYSGIIETIGFEDRFIEQGTVNELFEQENITEERIQKTVKKLRGI